MSTEKENLGEAQENPPTVGEAHHPAETGATLQFPEGVEPNINELFNRNPLDWSDDDLEQVVLHFQKSRELFLKGREAGEKGSGGNKRKASTAARQALKKPLTTLNLNDLGL